MLAGISSYCVISTECSVGYHILHDNPSYLCCPDVLSMVGASVRYQLLTFSHLNPSPPTYHQRSRIHVDRLAYNNACHEPSVTDASNPKKQLYSDTSANEDNYFRNHIR